MIGIVLWGRRPGGGGATGQFELDRRLQYFSKRDGVSIRGPDLELRIAGGPDPDDEAPALVLDREPGNDLRVAAVEALGEAHDRAQQSNRLPTRTRKAPVPSVRLLRGGLPMISGDETNHLHFFGFEASKAAVLDEVMGVAMVAFVADVRANIVQERPVLQPLTLALTQIVPPPKAVEDGQ
jgi:hypothetical protein